MEMLKSDIEKEMLVSIVTACYNSSKTIHKAIESVLNQTYTNIEYIIADGQSTDDTLSIVESYRPAFEEKGITLKVISGPDSGIYGGMNKGIALAEGKIIGLVNSDDWYELNIIEKIVNKYKESPFDMCYCDINIINDSGKSFIKKSKVMKKYFTTRKWNHPTTFISKKIYNIRKYDESFRYYADWDMVLWIYKNYRRIYVINESLSNFSLGGATTSKSLKVAKKKMKERYQAYKNNDYSNLYFFECLFMDYVKELIIRIFK